jgi:ribA/ribD-fused uncharacterized protein
MIIREFQGAYRWLSNFSACKIVLDGVEYASVEHAYMSAKSTDSKWKLFCSLTKSPGVVKKASRSIALPQDWDSQKVLVMKQCLEQKFSQEPYRSLLLATHNAVIQEGNRWGDTFWGVCLRTGIGKNILGKLIMGIRQSIVVK